MSAAPLDTARGEPRLLGGRCSSCSEVMFPRRQRCPACAHEGVEEVTLPAEGTLWSYTVQRFRPPSPPFAGGEPDDFEPYGVGYVELPGALRVESRLLGDPGELRIGMPLRLVPLEVGGEGLYAFAPAGDGEGEG